MGSGKILIDGTETFVPVFTRLWEIAQEFVPYFIYIAIGALGISLLWKAVKYIMGYLNRKSTKTVREININQDDFKLNFEKNYTYETNEIKPVIYKNNYEREKARQKRIKRNQHREDNVL